jgi:hypothetical protein
VGAWRTFFACAAACARVMNRRAAVIDVALSPEEEADERRRDAEQQALKDQNRPEDYDRWPGHAGWVGNDE